MIINHIICDESQKPFFLRLAKRLDLPENTLDFICHKHNLSVSLSDQLNLSGIIILDTVITWSDFPNVFTGFKVLQDIRQRYHCKKPVFLFSYFPATYFEQMAGNDLKYRMIYGTGSHFIQFPIGNLPDVKAKLGKAKPLSEAALYDVVTMLCDLKGVVIDQLNHELSFNDDTNISALFKKITPYLTALQVQSIGLDAYEMHLRDALVNKDRDAFYDKKELLIKACSLYLTHHQTEFVSAIASKPAILMVDDRPKELKTIAASLQPYFEVVCATQADEAISILEEDQSNRISAIITDWRLYKDESLDYWQDLQGYEILEYAAKTGIRALFALTSQADYVVHQIRNIMGIRFFMFKKDQLRSGDQWYSFVNVLEEACEQTGDIIAGIPSGSGWTKAEKGKKSLHQQYIEARNSPDWPEYEEKISSESDKIWHYYDSILARTNTEALQEFSKRFGITLKNNLWGILIARRIAIGLYLNQGRNYQNINGKNYPRIDVYSIFKNRFYDDFLAETKGQVQEAVGTYKSLEEYIVDKMISASSGLLNTTLCLDIDSLPSIESLLPEERSWISRHDFKIKLQFEEDEDPAADWKPDNAFDAEPTAKDIKRISLDLDFLDTDEDDELV